MMSYKDVQIEYFGGLPDTVGQAPEPLGVCQHCGEPLYEGYEYVEWEGYYFCDPYCFMKYMGARWEV